MDRGAIKAKVRDLLATLLGVSSLDISDATRAEDVRGWDSLAHMRLLVGLEEAYGIQFGVSELAAPANVGELVDLVHRLARATPCP